MKWDRTRILHVALLFIFAGVLLGLLLIPWQWSLLMDDYTFNTWAARHPRLQDLLPGFDEGVLGLLNLGRFLPLWWLLTTAIHHFLSSPLEFKIFNFLILSLSGLFGIAFVAQELGISRREALSHGGFALIATMFLHRPIFDILVFNQLPQMSIVFFFSLGLFLFRKSTVYYRLFFLFSSLTSEQGTTAFLFSSTYYAVCCFQRFREHGKWRAPARNAAIQCGVDLGIFLILVFKINQIRMMGPYLADYKLLSFSNIIPFSVGLLKASLGFAPFLILLCLGWRRHKTAVSGKRELLPVTLGLLAYFFTHLYIVSARAPLGYRLIPCSFVLYLFGVGILLESKDVFEKTSKWALASLGGLSLLIYGLSAIKAFDLAASINNTTVAVESAFQMNPVPVVVFRGEESAGTASKMALDRKSSLIALDIGDLENSSNRSWVGRPLIYIESEGYWGNTLPREMEILNRVSGGWKEIRHLRGCRVYFGRG